MAARGATALADGQDDAAATDLDVAATLWREAEIPYETARTGALLGEARLARGERNAALLELRTAAITFEGLGAQPDADAVNDRVTALSVRQNYEAHQPGRRRAHGAFVGSAARCELCDVVIIDAIDYVLRPQARRTARQGGMG